MSVFRHVIVALHAIYAYVVLHSLEMPSGASSVVNVRVSCIRPAYQTLAEWCADSGNVYIGRRGVVFVDGVRFPSVDSPFANPFKITRATPRDVVVGQYRAYFTQRVERDAGFRAAVLGLRGKVLGCWCHPEACHGDVIAAFVNQHLCEPPCDEGAAPSADAPKQLKKRPRD
jgi:hypothetical protein